MRRLSISSARAAVLKDPPSKIIPSRDVVRNRMDLLQGVSVGQLEPFGADSHDLPSTLICQSPRFRPSDRQEPPPSPRRVVPTINAQHLVTPALFLLPHLRRDSAEGVKVRKEPVEVCPGMIVLRVGKEGSMDIVDLGLGRGGRYVSHEQKTMVPASQMPSAL